MHDLKLNDDEGRMARADLFKLAKYSTKLFKMIDDNQQLDGWVQAKITKAADYIASVYHYMEYELKVSDYGNKLENGEMYSESVKRAYEQKLTEAKEKMARISAKSRTARKGIKGKTANDLDEANACVPPYCTPDGDVLGPKKAKTTKAAAKPTTKTASKENECIPPYCTPDGASVGAKSRVQKQSRVPKVKPGSKILTEPSKKSLK